MPAKILIADDNELMRSNLRLLLESCGWEVCGEADNGQEAILSAAAIKPDLIILDLSMPVMNGLQAAQQIKKLMSRVPIVIFTLHASPQIELEAQKAGARRVVSKADPHSLLSAVKALLAEAPAVTVVGKKALAG